jgi:dethiobiotin synthetase
MNKGLFIAGTDTEVGKTYVTCQLIREYRRAGVDAVGMKPVASGMQEVDGQWINEDIEQIWQVSDEVVSRELINQYAFTPFIAPHLAAAEAGELISLQKIEDSYARLAERAKLVIVEGAGGLMTPLNDSETFVDLIQQLDIGVVLVVAIRLGCINHALLTQQAMQSANIKFVGWVANYPAAELCADTQIETTLKKRLGAPCLGALSYGGGAHQVPSLDMAAALSLAGFRQESNNT